MWGRKRRRIEQLEGDVAELRDKLAIAYAAHARQGQRLRGQRDEIRNLTASRTRIKAELRVLADNALLVLRNKGLRLAFGAVHDGNHLEDCDACVLWRQASEYSSDVAKLVRARGHGTRIAP